MRFTKMEGLGNDYIYLYCMEGAPPDLPGLAVRLSDLHRTRTDRGFFDGDV